MTVPVHNLYDFVHQVTKNKFLLLYFYPWGQKGIENLIPYIKSSIDQLNGVTGISLNDRTFWPPTNEMWYNHFIGLQPVLLCHDQEPLNFDLYKKNSAFVKKYSKIYNKKRGIDLPANVENLRLSLPISIQKTWTLLHSEINSPELTKYESTGRFQGAYWWSHAIIARDWYRFAQHDQFLNPQAHRRLFLIYNRDETGSRIYRKTFRNLVTEYQLEEQCQFGSFNNSVVTAESSAVYNAEDFNYTAISVVLETTFDQRIHLTEKILRAIACGHPFILAAGPGSLQLLKSYGFRTFSGYIDESYDNIVDPELRLSAIVKEMKRISSLPVEQQARLIEVLRTIAAYNQRLFFSDNFFQQVVDQLKNNVATAFEAHKGEIDIDAWWQRRQLRKKQLGKNWKEIPNINDLAKTLIPLCRQHRLSRQVKPEQ